MRILEYWLLPPYSPLTTFRRPSNKLKPNTRFLRNIIKGTNRHNEALLAKEQSEAQARLKDLAEAEEEKRRRYRPSANEIRGRQLGNITALLSGQSGGQKRKRPAADDEPVSDLRQARAAEDARRLADTAAARRRAREKEGNRKRSLERYSVRKSRDGEKDEDETYYRANTSSEDEQRRESGKKRRHKRRSRSPQSKERRHRHRSPLRHRDTERGFDVERVHKSSPYRKSPPPSKPATSKDEEDSADSDSLEGPFGPRPPPKVLPRGRGALRGSSGMDSRFASNYDPKVDVQLDKDDTRDDWDEALEALRDRAKWRQQGADRLREAGFTEDQVKKWEQGDEKTIDDVQWTKAGEKREWDRGKDLKQDNGD